MISQSFRLKAKNCNTSKRFFFFSKILRSNCQISLQTQDWVHCEFYHYLRLDWLSDAKRNKIIWKIDQELHCLSPTLFATEAHILHIVSASLGLRNLHSNFLPLFVPVAAFVFPFTSFVLTYFFTLVFVLPVAREEHHEIVCQFLELFLMRSSLFLMSNILSGSADIESPVSVDCEMTAGIFV